MGVYVRKWYGPGGLLVVLGGVAAVIVYTLWGGPAGERESRAQVAGTFFAVLAAIPPVIRWAIERFRRSRAADRLWAGVASVVTGEETVGLAVRVGARRLVCLPRVVNRALHRKDDDVVAPHPQARVEVVFPAGEGSGGESRSWTKVIAWGPSRPFRADVAVLRATQRAMRRSRSLKLSSHPRPKREASSAIVLPDAGTGAMVPVPVADVDLQRRWVRTSQPVPKSSVGAPVVAGGVQAGTGPSRDVLALVADESTGLVGAGSSGSQAPLVTAGEIRAVMGEVRRRTVIRCAIAGAGLAVAAGGARAWTTSQPPGPQLTSLDGAGWQGLFTDPKVADYLKAYRLDVAANQYSGVESLTLCDQARCGGLDFVTCPNRSVMAGLREKRDKATGDISSPVSICQGTMVVLTRQRYLPGLVKAGLLVDLFEADRYRVGIDLAAYLRGYGRTWLQVDPAARRYAVCPAQTIKVGFSNPLKAGGGEVFLSVLDEVGTTKLNRPESERGRRLWNSPDSPLYSEGEDATRLLLGSFLAERQEMVYVYEHDAIAFLMDPELARPEEFAVLRTWPQAYPEHFLLTFTEKAKPLRDLMTRPAWKALIAQRLYAETGTVEDYEKLRESPRLRLSYQYDLPPLPERASWRATLQARRMQDLVEELRTSVTRGKRTS